MIKRYIRSAVLTCVLAVTCYASAVMGHGKTTPDEDPCSRVVGENMVHLTIYQPQHDKTQEYCTEIPLAGDSYLVVDLITPDLRNMPVGVKLFRGTAEEGEVITHIPTDYHSDGVISGMGRLEKGLYSVVITAEGIPPLDYHYQLRVDMVDYGKIMRIWVGPGLALLLFFWLTYRLVRTGLLRKWFGTGRE